MKRTVLLFVAITIAFSTSVFSNVWRVNNTLNTDAAQKLFKTLQEAHDASSVAAGDTLLVEGTSIVHPTIVISKRLVIIGTGYLLTSNPQTQFNPAMSIFSKITIKPEAAGSILIGLTFADNNSSFAPYIEADNVIVMRCHLNAFLYLSGDVNNVQIIQNFFERGGITHGSSADRFTNIVLKNNIIYSGVSISSSPTIQRSFSVVENNIFLGSVTLTATVFRNNIITYTSAAVSISSSTIQNNLAVKAGLLPTDNGNQVYVAANLFVGATGTSEDGQYKLKDNSPYLTAGFGGTQPGIFGGTMPYVLSGMPPIPAIYELVADGFGSKQNGLQVTIKAKANQ